MWLSWKECTRSPARALFNTPPKFLIINAPNIMPSYDGVIVVTRKWQGLLLGEGGLVCKWCSVMNGSGLVALHSKPALHFSATWL